MIIPLKLMNDLQVSVILIAICKYYIVRTEKENINISLVFWRAASDGY